MPMFHAFGLTVGTLLPLLSGVPVLPLSDAAALPAGAGADLWHDATIVFGTDTFLARLGALCASL